MENQEKKMETISVENETNSQNTANTDSNIGRKLLATLFYVVGIVLMGVCIYYLSNDLRPEYSFEKHYYFDPKEYVGGDAYNYIISAARSTAIMVKALVYAVLGCTSLILGQLICKK